MPLFNALYSIIIAPIEFIIEIVFVFYNAKIGVAGIAGAIFAVSLTMNFLALPIYNVADTLQERERAAQEKLSKWVLHIKKNFKGDERFMTLQTYYRQNNYHPLYALRSSLSILFEIPFFIAAYHFLSHSEALNGARFFILQNLGEPDALAALPIGRGGVWRINILPILMTLINFVSGAVYLKNAPAKEKLQLYALALIFLLILYRSPSGLVFYWILNNLFSLAKNIVYKKVKNPRQFAHKAISAILLFTGVFIMTQKRFSAVKRLAVLAAALLITFLPAIIGLIKRAAESAKGRTGGGKKGRAKESLLCFALSALGLALTAGLSLPAAIIASSPIEFSFIGSVESPLTYLYSSFLFFFGIFFFWPMIIYKLYGENVKNAVSAIWPIILAGAFLNAYVFKCDYGTTSAFLQLERSDCLRSVSPLFSAMSFFAFLIAAAAIFLLRKRRLQKYLSLFLLIFCIAQAAFGITKITQIHSAFAKYEISREMPGQKAAQEIEVVYHLSRDKKNVVFLFLDRAISAFLPYVVQEFPEMKEQFSGFVYYPNTVSYAGYTAKAAPAMMGGYEYTPENMNKRQTESLRDKHNEATLVLPKLFLDAGFDVTVTDPPYPNYTFKGDLSAFKNYPQMRAQEITGKYTAFYESEAGGFSYSNLDDITQKNLESFVLLEISPPFLRNSLYHSGDYYRNKKIPQLLNTGFLSSWTSLYYLPKLTAFDNENPTYTFIDNETTHEYVQLQNHTYLPSLEVNSNSILCGSYEFAVSPNSDRESDAIAYHVNAAALIQIAKWLDYLKENSCYDNTRIIIVSDHGRDIPLEPFKKMKYGDEYAGYNPLFMAKDFGARGTLATDNSFMTNADALFFAKAGLDVSEKNPFTGNIFEERVDKSAVRIHEIVQCDAFSEMTPPTLGDKKLWVLQDEKYHTPSYIVHDNIFDEKNWERIVK